MRKTLGMMLLLSGLAIGPAWAQTPPGWFLTGSAPKDFEVGIEPGTRTAGSRDAFIRAKADSGGFATLSQTVDAADYRGKRVRFSAYLRTSGAGKAMLWMRIDDAERKPISMDNMEQRPVRGDTGWRDYAVVQDVPEGARSLSFGVLLANKGQLWASGLVLEIVGKDVPVTGNVYALPTAPVNLDFSH